MKGLRFIYGTAWKTTATAQWVRTAIENGFVAIDTANQPKHYAESLVGDALVQLQAHGVRREQLFLQTKFTHVSGQDSRIPYDPKSDIATQVYTSFQSSLEHLRTDYVDSYLLHGPSSWPGLGSADRQAWGAMENIYSEGKTKSIGISNVNLEQLRTLVTSAKVKPMIVQNRCYAEQGWDQGVREYCLLHNIMYQGFSLLTANVDWLTSDTVKLMAERLHKTPEQVAFRFAIDMGITPLTGTRNAEHMRQDLAVYDFELDDEDRVELGDVSQAHVPRKM